MQTLNANPKSEHGCHETSQMTCLQTHQPNYFSNFLAMSYFDKYNNSIPDNLFMKNNHIKQKHSHSVFLKFSGAFPTRAQIQVLSPNRSCLRPIEIPNSFEIPKNYLDFKFCISSILISGNKVMEF